VGNTFAVPFSILKGPSWAFETRLRIKPGAAIFAVSESALFTFCGVDPGRAKGAGGVIRRRFLGVFGRNPEHPVPQVLSYTLIGQCHCPNLVMTDDGAARKEGIMREQNTQYYCAEVWV
jgi:hypothetical protein